MRKINFTFLFLVVFSKLFAQTNYFEGVITYKHKFISPDGQDITKIVAEQLGSEQVYSVNSKNYKSVLNGAAIKMQLFNSEENKYFMISGSNEVQEFDAATITEEILKIEQIEKPTEIMGLICKGIVVKGKESITTYYFNENLKVDQSIYQKHNLGNWNEYMNASNGALPLKFTLSSSDFTWEATAIKIEKKKLNNDEFTLPFDAKKD